MAGGLIQLVAYGVQDLYLSGDPQITFFKIVYRRHTSFAIESIVQHFSTEANFGETASCTLSKSGDLVGRIFLYVQMPAIPKFINITGNEDPIKKIAWVKKIGYAIVDNVAIEIGGKLIDKQYGEWMHIWSEVSGKQDHALMKMIGDKSDVTNFTNGKSGFELYIPLEFWFCRNNGLSLPIVALQSSEIKLSVTFRRAHECYRITPTNSIEVLESIVPFTVGDHIEQTINNQTIKGIVTHFDYLCNRLYYTKISNPNCPKKSFEASPVQAGLEFPDNLFRIYDNSNKLYYCTPKPNTKESIESTSLFPKPQIVNSFLYVDYVYLDNNERKKFSTTNHEYLIEQVQFNQQIGVTSPNVKVNLSFSNPCKAIYWVAQLDTKINSIDLFDYTESNSPIVTNSRLVINGKDRFSSRSSTHFNLVEPYEHHHRGPTAGINVYSFALNPELHQPSSAINMSKIDQASLEMHLDRTVSGSNPARVRIYALSYNILRVYFNMGAVAFV